MYPILGRYGPFFLYSYSVSMWLGLVAVFGLTSWLVKRRPLPNWSDGMLISLGIGLIGGRIGFVAGQWEYFHEHLDEAGQIWQGGMSYHSAVIAAVLALWGWSRWRGQRASDYFALLAPGLPLMSAFGWSACWLHGCAYGAPAPFGPLAADLPDSYGIFELRYQTQLLGMGVSALLFIMCLWWQRRHHSARLFWAILLFLSLARGVISLLRGDAMPHLGALRLDTVLEAALALSSLVLLQYQRNGSDRA